MRGLRKRHGRGRHGRALGPQAITRPAGAGLYDVVIVNGRGDVLETLHRRLPYGAARKVIARRHR